MAACRAEGQTTRRVTDLMAAFGQFPRLPRLLRPEALYDTLKRGVRKGVLVLRVRRPAAALLAEAVLDPAALQKLAERVEQLLLAAPELAFTFRVAISAEGQRPDPETLARLNALLAEVRPGWRFGV